LGKQWLGHHINAQQDLADVWAPGQDMSNPDSWTAPILTALKGHAKGHLRADYECTEWGLDAGPELSDAPVAIAGPADAQNLTADSTGHRTPPSALPSLVLPPLSMLFESNQGEGRHYSSSEAQQQAGDRPPADPSQRIITAHLMQCWKVIVGA